MSIHQTARELTELRLVTNSTEALPDTGNRFLVGNGYMGVRGALEEHGKDELAAVNLAGIYDRCGAGWREPLNAPNPFSLRLYRGETPLALPDAPVRGHEQALDARHGLHSRRTVFADGTALAVERFAHMEQVHRLCLRARVSAGADGEYALEAALDGDVWDIHGPHYARMTLSGTDDFSAAVGVSNEGDGVAVAARYAVDPPQSAVARVEGRRRVVRYVFRLRAGQTVTLTLLAAVYTGKDGPDPLAAARELLDEPADYDRLRERHIACWDGLWRRANVAIGGDKAAEDALNYSAYHLLSIAPRHAASLSVPARGLSGQTYKGAIFWDTEMFMLDFYLAVLPEVAKTLLRYRVDTLSGARDKARRYGFRGAFYAWESQEGGFDACSDYNVTDVFTGRPMRTYFRDKQIHITAAVVYGLCKYAVWTGDDSLWLEGGAEVLVEAARFYHSRMIRALESDEYELRDVIGPDEYHERVDNNAYTNELARFTLQKACEVLPRLRAEHPAQVAALEAKLGFERELDAFADAAARLKRQEPNADGVIEQFDGYFALEDATVDAVRARLKDPREYWGGAYGVAAQTQVIKQADVITLLYMLRDRYDSETLRANYNYYLPRTEHGSSLSACMYALAACGVGRPDEAYPLFLKSAQADWLGGGKQWAGLVYIGGTHPAAAGGAYMALLWGFMGLTLTGGRPTLSPRLPAGWTDARCAVCWHGEEIELAARA